MRQQKQLSEREAASIGPRATKNPYSVEFAYQQASWLKTLYKSKQATIHEWEEALAEAEQYHIYDRIPPEKPYGTLETLLKNEIGVGTEEARIHVVDRAAQGEKEKNIKRGPRTSRAFHYNVMKLNQGNGASYLSRRIARDHPKILEKMKNGEFKSVRAAAIEAGIIKPPTVVEQLTRLWNKATAKEKQEFLKITRVLRQTD